MIEPNRQPRPGGAARASRAGFSLVEVMIAAVVLVLALSGAVSSIVSTSILGDTNRESTIAYQAARRVMEQLQATEHRTLIHRFNDDPDDDPFGPNTAPGEAFTVPGLDLQPDDPDGFAGRIIFPLDKDELREDFEDPMMGMPRDLTGDGVIDNDDHKDDHIILPVRVRVEWRGKSGDRFVEFSTVLGRRR